jgi:hypothetical protein
MSRRPNQSIGVPGWHWLFYFVLALPAVLLPQFGYMGLNRVRYNLGWPVSGMDILIGGIEDGQILHFQPSPALLAVAALWTWMMGLAWRARRWAKIRSDGLGAFVQATLTSLYCALVFCFLDGVVQVVWNWRLFPMRWAELERTLTFGRHWLPYLYALGAAAIFVILLLDARLRPRLQRIVHVAFALCFVFVLWRFSPYLDRQSGRLDELIEYAKKQQRIESDQSSRLPK